MLIKSLGIEVETESLDAADLLVLAECLQTAAGSMSAFATCEVQRGSLISAGSSFVGAGVSGRIQTMLHDAEGSLADAAATYQAHVQVMREYLSRRFREEGGK